jgi:hypothetical protein
MQVWPRTVAAGAVAGALFLPAAPLRALTRCAGHCAAMLLLLLLLLLRMLRQPSARRHSQ